MGTTPVCWYHSLKVKITLLLLLGGLAAGMFGVWITYQATGNQLQQRLLVRVGTLASAVNHAAMAGSNWPIVQHMIEAIVQEEPDIRNIIVVGKSSRMILASSSSALVGESFTDLSDGHLRQELAAALEQGHFGSHFESDSHPDQAGNLVVLVPLQPPMAVHGMHGSHSDMQGGHNHGKMHGSGSHHQAPGADRHDHGSMKMPQPSGTAGAASKIEPYRGAILIVASKNVVLQGVWDALWRYILILIAAVIIILRIAYLALNHQVIRPLESIRDAINRRKSGDSSARVHLTQNDEIKEVAETLNETLDSEDAHGKQLSEVNEQLTAAVVTAESANVAKSVFLANMSHELRTPLNAIIGFSDIMRTEALGPVGSTRYKEYSKDINQAGLHLLNLINDVLDLSKIEAEKDELFEENFDIHSTLESVISMVQQRADKNDVTLKFDIADDVPFICADERKVKQVLTNLLTNAIKFTKRDGCVTTVARCHPTSGFEFKFTDTGIGIAPDDIPKALSQFGQVDSDLNRKYEGSGLGLPLTKAIVELHGGSLELESEVGVGTTITVRFPAWRIVPGLNVPQRSSL